MKNRLLFPVITALFIFTTPAIAWNANGHILISQMAYEQLTPAVQKKVDQLSAKLFKQLPFSTQYQLNDQYPNTSEFAKLSVLPDQFRKQPLRSLFEQYDGKLPSSLENLAEENTQHWHFTNRTYPNQNCPAHASKHDILWTINTLKPIVKNEKDPLSQGLALAMLTHFIEDIHQPLHTFSHNNESCKTDKGGNLFCLSPSFEGRRCKHNLHHLWDTGVGFLKGRQTNFPRKMTLIKEAFPASILQKEIQQTNPEQWAQESYSYAKFVYSTEPNTRPEKAYYHAGQEIAKKQMAIASYRLAYTLNDLLGLHQQDLNPKIVKPRQDGSD